MCSIGADTGLYLSSEEREDTRENSAIKLR